MPYRDETPSTAVERLRVDRNEPGAVATLLGIGGLMAIVIACVTYGTVDFRCSRAKSDGAPVCTAHTGGVAGRDLGPFRVGSAELVNAVERHDKKTPYYVITTPGGDVGGPAVDKDFAVRTAASFASFLDDPATPSWSAEASTLVHALLFALCPIALMTFLVLLSRPRYVVLDRGLRALSLPGGASWPFDELTAAEMRPQGRGRAELVVVGKAGTIVLVPDGTVESVTGVAMTVTAALTAHRSQGRGE